MFETSNYSEIFVTIKGKYGNDDISYKFVKDKYHMIPILGLYSDYENTVILKSEDKEKSIKIKTDKLPDDFLYVDNQENGNYKFYNNNYPYLIDSYGEVRWFLNEHYYGDVSFNNSVIYLGSNRYNENGIAISLYKMNLLGKIYNEYMLSGGYYGYNSVLDDNDLLVLSDYILLIDTQTGEIISKYVENDNYNYLGFVDNEIVILKDDKYYAISDEKIIEREINISTYDVNIFNNILNYRIVNSRRLGLLDETKTCNSNITVINYDDVEDLLNVDIVKEVNRIRIINNNEEKVYIIFDKFMDKRIYEVDHIKYINNNGLSGRYTIYIKINKKIYKTDYFVEV